MVDKRRCHRLNIELPAILTIEGEKCGNVATIIDVSAKGVRLLTNEQLVRGQKRQGRPPEKSP